MFLDTGTLYINLDTVLAITPPIAITEEIMLDFEEIPEGKTYYRLFHFPSGDVNVMFFESFEEANDLTPYALDNGAVLQPK
jgi:hypothetical protein